MSAEHFQEDIEFEMCVFSRWCHSYAVTFYNVKQRFNLKSSIANQLMEFFQVGMIMHVSLLLGWTFIFYPGSDDGEDKMNKHWLVLGPFQYELSRLCVCVRVGSVRACVCNKQLAPL